MSKRNNHDGPKIIYTKDIFNLNYLVRSGLRQEIYLHFYAYQGDIISLIGSLLVLIKNLVEGHFLF
jgi:hypothetical protein